LVAFVETLVMAVVSKNQTQQQTPNPGGGVSRIEDSTNGKTCHQVRFFSFFHFYQIGI